MTNDLQNTGLIEQEPQPTDYVAGAQSPLVWESINPSGNWHIYLPSEEAQSSVYFDTMACTIFSALNCIETQLNFLKLTARIPRENLQFLEDNGYLENEKVNTSDRYIAKVSGNTRQGNYLQKVADTIRHYGLIPEKDWNYPRDQRQPVFDWNDYYKDIPQNLIDKGQEFLKWFDISYEWIQSDIKHHLQQAPLQITIPLCQGFFTDPVVKVCGLKQSAHAVELYASYNVNFIFDSYPKFEKTLQPDYPIPYYFKLIIKPKPQIMIPTKQEISQLYQAVFHRTPSDTEVNAYTGQELSNILTAFLGSKEYAYYDGINVKAKELENAVRNGTL